MQGRVLDGIGLTAIAVFDVSRFILEEEIVRRRMLESPGEARRSLTKFMTIIVIATSLEALVSIFEVKDQEVGGLIYPAILLSAGVLALIGMGLFQWLTSASERATAPARQIMLLEELTAREP